MLKNKKYMYLRGMMVLCLILGTLPLAAQEEPVVEKPLTIVDGSHLTVSARMGYSNMMVNSEKVKNSPGGFCVGAELDYTHFVSDHVGLRVGCDVSLHTSRYNMASYSAQSTEEVEVLTSV